MINNIFQALGLLLTRVILALLNVRLDNSIGYILRGPIGSLVLIYAYLYSKKFIKLDFEWEQNYS